MYRLSDVEVRAVFGLSCELLDAVEVALGAASEGGLIVGDPLEAFFGSFGKHQMEPQMLLGFGKARPLSLGDVGVLAGVTHVPVAGLVCGEDPVELYGVSCRLEAARQAMGAPGRRKLAARCSQPKRVLHVLGMASVVRPQEATLRRYLHAAWHSDPAGEARVLAGRWSVGVAPPRGGRRGGG